jgi:hypothetical protein
MGGSEARDNPWEGGGQGRKDGGGGGGGGKRRSHQADCGEAVGPM